MLQIEIKCTHPVRLGFWCSASHPRRPDSNPSALPRFVLLPLHFIVPDLQLSTNVWVIFTIFNGGRTNGRSIFGNGCQGVNFRDKLLLPVVRHDRVKHRIISEPGLTYLLVNNVCHTLTITFCVDVRKTSLLETFNNVSAQTLMVTYYICFFAISFPGFIAQIILSSFINSFPLR